MQFHESVDQQQTTKKELLLSKEEQESTIRAKFAAIKTDLHEFCKANNIKNAELIEKMQEVTVATSQCIFPLIRLC